MKILYEHSLQDVWAEFTSPDQPDKPQVRISRMSRNYVFLSGRKQTVATPSTLEPFVNVPIIVPLKILHVLYFYFHRTLHGNVAQSEVNSTNITTSLYKTTSRRCKAPTRNTRT